MVDPTINCAWVWGSEFISIYLISLYVWLFIIVLYTYILHNCICTVCGTWYLNVNSVLIYIYKTCNLFSPNTTSIVINYCIFVALLNDISKIKIYIHAHVVLKWLIICTSNVSCYSSFKSTICIYNQYERILYI